MPAYVCRVRFMALTGSCIPSVGAVHRASQCRDFDKLYETKGDFQRAPEFRRLVVIGCTGAGKSTLLNVMGGWQFVQVKTSATRVSTGAISDTDTVSRAVQDQSDFNWSWKDKGDQVLVFQPAARYAIPRTEMGTFRRLLVCAAPSLPESHDGLRVGHAEHSFRQPGGLPEQDSTAHHAISGTDMANGTAELVRQRCEALHRGGHAR